MNIKDITDRNPEALLAMSDNELSALLAPFFPAVRQAVMPPEKARKLGLERRMLQSFIAANKDEIAAAAAKLKGT
jgi:hypothetical protein